MRLPAWLQRFFGGGPALPSDPLAAIRQSPPEQVRLVVGLGNPGDQYVATRHNVGFLCVDALAERCGFSWQSAEQEASSLIACGIWQGVPLVLAKPQTFMNDSGVAARQLLQILGLEIIRMLVVYDDMDLPFGTLRLRQRGSAGTHNGMRSVVKIVESESMPRLRIGIGQAGAARAIDHVLGGFTDPETKALPGVIDRAADAAVAWATTDAATAMNQFNG